MSEPIVKIVDLKKSYGNKQALNGVSLELEGGKVLGILGPNGSGKTTLIKILTGLQKKSSGNVSICGENPSPKTKAWVSYLPDRNFLYENFSIKECLDLFEDFFEDFNRNKAEDMLKFMELDEHLEVSSLSKGMKEKLHLTLVLCRDAKLFILDEPIAGVDPIARDQILEAIVNNINENSTMIITTHLVRDMESIFDDVAFLSNGDILLQGNSEELRNERNMSIDELYKDILG